METHAEHLHHAPGRTIKHYFFEFLMLFLAVFCGFVAENWREQMREHQREKKFIYSLVEDLKSDTGQSNKILIQLKKTKTGIDSVLKELSSPGIIENSNKAYSLWTENLDIKAFVSNDRTIQQLKNSGELRLIRNKAVSDRIMEYDQMVKNYYQQSNFMYSALSDQHIYSQFFDFIRLNNSKKHSGTLNRTGKKIIERSVCSPAIMELWPYGVDQLAGRRSPGR